MRARDNGDSVDSESARDRRGCSRVRLALFCSTNLARANSDCAWLVDRGARREIDVV